MYSSWPTKRSTPPGLQQASAASRSWALSAAKYRLATSEVDIEDARVYASISSAAMSRRRELARGERVLPGIWRLRLPLPWPGVPHCNAWAIAAGAGIVLVDTGMHQPGSLAQLELALDQVNLRLEHVRLIVCTHAHTDHWGQAAPIKDRSGAPLWMHPNHQHATQDHGDPQARIARRLEVGRQSG